MIESIDQADLNKLVEEAHLSTRLRTHRFLHDGPDDPVQRFLIAAANGTYVRPHVHSKQWEILVLLRGSAAVLQFQDDGQIDTVFDLSSDATNLVQIPKNTFHGFVVTGAEAVVMEIKPGPYRPNEFATWTPEEGSDDVAKYLEHLTKAMTE